MTRRLFVLIVLLSPVGGCADRSNSAPGSGAQVQGPAGRMADMPGMRGMPGMAAMPGMRMPGDSGVQIDRRVTSQYGINFARAAERPVRPSIRLVGTLAYAEPRREYVNVRVQGWVERLYADYVGRPVQQGEPLLALYSPELLSAQEEYLTARRLGDSALTSAARRRLALWDVPADQIDSLDHTGSPRHTIVLRAPRSGEIVEKMVTQGQAVQAGENLLLIADRSVLWIDVALYEMDVPLVRLGTPVRVTVDVLGGREYDGRVSFIYPAVDPKTRTLTARVEVANRDGRLRPGMFAAAVVTRSPEWRALSVPLGAVLPTGIQEIVFVNRGDGTFIPRPVKTGARGDSLIEVLQGLNAGDEVVASATYLLDSETNLASAMQGLMLQMGMGLDMGGMKIGDSAGRTGGRAADGQKTEERR